MTRATTSWHASSDHQTSVIKGGLLTVSRKTAAVLLTNKEQLSATLPEDKDNQGGT
jgi:hypothetical protein